MLQKLLQTLLFLFLFLGLNAQDFSNKGKDFWVGYGYHQSMIVDNNQNMVLYFTSDVNASVKVEIPSLGWVRTYNVSPNSVIESDLMPKSGAQDARLLSEGIYNAGIHITSDQPIVAYSHIYNSTVSGASLLFPVATLGQDYYSLNFTQKANIDNSNCWTYVVATEDNTAVEIIPSANTLTHSAGQSFIVTLNRGQIYNLMGITNGNNGEDLTGTRVRSVSTGTSGCKKIAVFSGSGRLSINCDNAVTSSDNIIQQVFPRSAWGRKYLTVPTSQLPNNYFRIAVSDPSTVVTIDGVQATNLINGFYYEVSGNTPKMIVADKPVMVAQYITSANIPTCGNSSNNKGDPEMIYISPIEQTIDKITLNSTNHYQITSHYINVIIRSSAVNSFTLDGNRSPASFHSHPQDPAYSYAVFSVAQGSHSLKADSGFNAIAYGYGTLESYGYNAGTNIKDLYQFVTLQNPYATVNSPITCQNTKFLFSITLPYQASSLTWDFGNNAHIAPNQNITNNNPVPDSTYTRDGRNLYVYRLPAAYTYNAIGTYPLKIVADNQSADGCNGQQELTYDIEVTSPLTSDFTVSHSGCATDTAFFKDVSSGNGRTLQKRFWFFGDNTTDTALNPHKSFAGAGTYNVKLTSVNDIGCSADTIEPFTIAPQPISKFGVSDTTCINSFIAFTDSSSGGNIAKWHWNFDKGDTATYSTNARLEKTFSLSGNYNISLQVENAAGCKSEIYKKTITIHSLPVIDFDMQGGCLPAANGRFTNRTTIDDGTENGLTYLWSFGDGATSFAKDPTHTYTAAGPFNINLKATSISGCTHDSTKIFFNIYAQPKAGFSYTPSNICVSDSVHFFDSSVATNSSITAWFWNFGDGTISDIQNPAKKYADSGSYNISLYARSAAGCISDTIKKIIYINKLPTAAFTISGVTCEKQLFTITDQAQANSGRINNWHYNFGDGTSSDHTNGNAFSKSYNAPGKYIIKLAVETDKGCKSDTAEQTVTVQTLPVANFILPVVCINDAFATFNDSSYIPDATGANLSYKWSFGDAYATVINPNTSIIQNAQHKYTVPGKYNISLTVTSNTGCSSTIIKAFTVNGGSPYAIFKIIDSTALCSNKEVQIQNYSSVDIGNITKVQIIWDVNDLGSIETDNASYTGKIYSHKYAQQTVRKTYQIKVKAFSGTNCVDEKIIPVTIHPSPKITFSAVPDLCLNDSGLVISQAKETSGLAGNFVFSGKGINSSGLFTPSLAGAGQITITYIYTSSNGCTDSASQTIVVVPNPTVQLPKQIYVLEGGSVVLEPSVTGNALSYIWTPNTYLDNASIQNPRSTPKENITYDLTVGSAGGCTASGKVSLSLLKSLGVPNAFSPNGDGINDFWNIPALASFPNCVVEVFNRYGTLVFNSIGYARPWNGTFNSNNLPVGVYYYIIDLKDGRKPYTGNITILK